MVPLDVTHKAAVNDKVLEAIEKRCMPDSKFAKMVVDLLLFFKHTYETVYHLYNGPPLHDPCAVAILVAPEIFTIRHLRVDVVTDNGLALGQTVSACPRIVTTHGKSENRLTSLIMLCLYP
jgi:inosine-uridine nucleoside N-ribohydrolase